MFDKLIPAWAKSESVAKPQAGSVSPPPPTPITGVQSATVSSIQGVSSYGAPPHDQVLTDKIISMVTGTVPSIKDLLAEADKIKAMEPDLGKRLNMVMTLKGFTSAQAADATLALSRALDSVRQQSESEIEKARAEQVERPRQKVNELGTRKQALISEITQIDAEISASNERTSQAETRIHAEQARLTGSVAQAKAWIDSIARLITKS